VGSVKRICLIPRLAGVGGMVSFQHKLVAGLAQRGVQVTYDPGEVPDAVLVVGGTRQLAALWQMRRRGIPVVQRLDGMNWLHRLRMPDGSRTGLRHYLRSEYGNLILSFIRSRLADYIVYQSEFSQVWWERARGPTPVPASVVYNGIDLQRFTGHGEQERPLDRWRLLMVEGSLLGGYEVGLESGVELARQVAARSGSSYSQKLVELMVVGRSTQRQQQRWRDALAGHAGVELRWEGLVPHERIPAIDRSAHLLYSADLNAACPNSVIEALACGLPVVAFDTGALPELVAGDAGKVVAYGGDPWKLEPADIPALAQAACEVLEDQEHYRAAARRRAESLLGLEHMTDGYLQAFVAARAALGRF
jgi:glycosyltransferase involved in cell wall biosynthesis